MTPASIIVLTYNTRLLTLQCLAAFAPALLGQGWQIIVVDNASHDGTVEALRAQFPHVEVICSERNLGFAGGNNLGLRHATGEFVWLMNSDVTAAPETLQAVLDALRAQPQVGMISPGLITATGRPQTFAYGGDPTLGYLLQRGCRAVFKHQAMHHWDITQPIVTDWVSRACLCARQSAIQQVGLLDERFQLYFEDNDWCLRFRQAGWQIVYDPRYRVTHLGGASQPQRHAANQLYYASLIKFYAKHYGAFNTLLLRLALAPYKLLIALQR